MRSIRPRRVAAGLAALLLLTEAAVRQAGVVSIPTYTIDDFFGYAPRSNQSGTFLRTNRWVFNDRSMGVDRPWRSSELTDILLIGNSVVMGGNPYDQKDKLTPQLQMRLGTKCPVWPVAAGGWTTVNEMRFLQRNSDLIAGSDFFIWEYMPGQMYDLNRWTRETLHPTTPPLWATWYVVSKALKERFPQPAPPAPSAAIQLSMHYQEFDALLGRMTLASGRGPAGLIFLYPDREQLARARSGMEWITDRQIVQRLAANHGIGIIDIARFPQWTDSMYRDPVHPTTEGNAVLAEILASAVQALTSMPECAHRTR